MFPTPRLIAFVLILTVATMLLYADGTQNHLLANLRTIHAIESGHQSVVRKACNQVHWAVIDVDTPLEAWCAGQTDRLMGDSRNPSIQLQKGVATLKQGRQSDAVEILQTVENADFFFVLQGFEQHKKQETAQAEHLFTVSEAINDTPKLRKFPMYQARCISLRDSPATVETAIENCERLVGYLASADNYFLLGRAYFEAGKYEAAKVAFADSLRLNETAYGFTWLARAESNIGNSALVRAYFDKAISLDPTYPWAHAYLADWLSETEAVGEATEVYQLTIAMENQAAASYAQQKLSQLQKQVGN